MLTAWAKGDLWLKDGHQAIFLHIHSGISECGFAKISMEQNLVKAVKSHYPKTQKAVMLR